MQIERHCMDFNNYAIINNFFEILNNTIKIFQIIIGVELIILFHLNRGKGKFKALK